jgi:hypothetical protein
VSISRPEQRSDDVIGDDVAQETCAVHDQFERAVEREREAQQRAMKSILDDLKTEIFPRLRSIELKIAWMTGLVGAALMVGQVLPWLIKLARYLDGK